MLEAKVPHVLPGSLTGTQPRMFHPPLPFYCLLQACCCALRAGKGRREALPAWITYFQEPQSGLSIRLWHWSLGENAMRSAAPFTATLLSTPSILALQPPSFLLLPFWLWPSFSRFCDQRVSLDLSFFIRSPKPPENENAQVIKPTDSEPFTGKCSSKLGRRIEISYIYKWWGQLKKASNSLVGLE